MVGNRAGGGCASRRYGQDCYDFRLRARLSGNRPVGRDRSGIGCDCCERPHSFYRRQWILLRRSTESWCLPRQGESPLVPAFVTGKYKSSGRGQPRCQCDPQHDFRSDADIAAAPRADSGRRLEMDAAFSGKPAHLAGFGADGFNAGRTVFSLEHSLFSDGKLSFNGNVGYGVGSPTTVWRASYSHQMATGSRPQVSFTMRRLAAPDAGLHDTALQALTLSVSDGFTLGEVLDLDFGSELQTIQFMGRVSAAHPFGSADLHLSPNTVLEYRYATT